MKKLRIIFLCVIAVVAAMLFTACGGHNDTTLEIDDMTIYANGAPVEIVLRFTGNAEAVTYEYDEFSLEIADGKIRAFKTGEFEVTAKSASCEVVFKVTSKNAISVDDLYAWIGYPASDISPVVELENAGEIVYDYDETMVSVSGNYVTALKEGKTEITATVNGYSTSFFVTCVPVSKSDPAYYMWGDGWNWANKATSGRLKYNKEGHDGKTTLFMGDSFFDIDFFSTFYQFYRNYDALCLGIGGTTSHQWEMFFDKDGVYPSGTYGQYAGIKPKNIVFQLGNNNIYNDQCDDKETAQDLQRFFTYVHGLLPETKLYYFGVTPRNVSMTSWEKTVRASNAAMGRFCATKDWIVYLDTTDQMTFDKLKDNIHPKPEEYKIFVDALEEAGLALEQK